MKTKLPPNVSQGGGVLVIVLFTIVVLGLILIPSYMNLVRNQNRAVVRSQAWNEALAVAEAAVEEALLNLNQNGPGAAANGTGWGLAGGYASVSRDFASNCTYTVGFSVGSSTPTITATGYVRLPAAYGTNIFVKRVIQVSTASVSHFPKGILARGSIQMNGNNVTVDSFDSTDPTYSTNGLYWPGHRKTNGDVATMLSITNSSFNIGNADIYGSAATGPGGVVSVGSQGFVKNGITQDANFTIADAVVPFATAGAPLPGSHGGTNYQYALGNGDYQLTGNFDPSGATVTVKTTNGTVITTNQVKQAMVINGKARLYVTGSLNLASSFAYIASNASVEIYVGTGSLTLSGNSTVNTSGRATNLIINALPAVTSVTFSGNADFTGAIYAPNANLTFNGGGNVSGSLVVKSITLGGNFDIHYDEAFRTGAPGGSYAITSWKEL